MVIDSPLQEHDEKRGIRVYYVRIGKDDEPALWIQRNAFGKSSAYVLPLDQAWQLGDDKTLMEKAFIAAEQLYLQIDKSTIHYLMDLLVKHVDALVQKIPPKAMETRAEIEDKLDRMGIRGMQINGESIL